ncbi:uncharacterized protein LOC122387617 isoform X2 [Amphibalanus amphitrite]|nr:uncharacterized protein LOC122387617 isoform X2 [Amphibalanus amphitrite]XP_043233908.1 uncharacterized protein LOC122387617 isoform X2 [Amphibalanus amphitrite]XP_043233910.1 uncharacterized protein LOC122387617 isoform X2 [Amphibalanus amphitrite]
MISGMIRSALASASSVPEAATGPAPTPASGAPEASTGPATAPDAVLRLAAAAAPTTSVPAPAARSGRLTGAMGLGDLQHPDIVSELADAALAPATIKAYRTTWAQFRHFLCRPAPRDLFPVSVSQVVDFLAHRYDAGCGSATLVSISSAISYGHKVRGLVDPTADFRVRQVLAGARRLRPGGDSRLAITVSDLGRLCSVVAALRFSPLEQTAFRAIFTLGFFALLRPSEVLRSGQQQHYLRLGNVALRDNTLTVTIPSSKTSVEPFTTQLTRRPDITVCPVSAVEDYLRVRGSGLPLDALFIGDNRRPITCRALTSVLRRAGRMAGLDAARLSGHCLRIGGASHGAAVGMTELQLGQAGRWSSQALRRYLRRPVTVLQATPSSSGFSTHAGRAAR